MVQPIQNRRWWLSEKDFWRRVCAVVLVVHAKGMRCCGQPHVVGAAISTCRRDKTHNTASAEYHVCTEELLVDARPVRVREQMLVHCSSQLASCTPH